MNNTEKHFYITTTLPYINSEPHVGFAMEIIRADVIARYKKSLGYEVFFNTGTDEHGQKIFDRAQAEGKEVQVFCDENSAKFRALLPVINISSDVHFIRTTDEDHILAAQALWNVCDENGYIYKKAYQTKYCVGCELEKTDGELDENGKCPDHPIGEIELRDEENYFFKFSAFGEKLLRFYTDNPHFVQPVGRFNEIKSFVERGLQDFSISRLKEKMSWGVPVPKDDSQVMYVWFDALTNYISTLGWPKELEQFEQFWVNGETVQYCGKDNLRQQTAMWQAMLMACGLPNTKQIIINGFINSGGQKMSKSIGNVISPFDVVNEYSTDALRYYLLREMSTFEDGDMTMEKFKEAYNANLANGLGNLTSRLLNMSATYGIEIDHITFEPLETDEIANGYATFDIGKVMDSIWGEINKLDKFIQETEPFKTIKTDPEKAKEDLRYALLRLSHIAVALAPLLPETSEKMIALIKENKKPETPLFLRKE